MGAIILIVAALLFGANLGTWFSVAMVALMGASILYNTQRIMQSYPAHAYVGASVTVCLAHDHVLVHTSNIH